MKNLAVWVSVILAVICLGALVTIAFWKGLIKLPMVEQSFALVSLGEEARLLVEFQIAEQQRQSFRGLFDADRIEVGLDSKSREQLKKILPAKLKLVLDGKRVWFTNSQARQLSSSKAREKIAFASDGASFVMEYSDIKDTSIEAVDVRRLLLEASRSGALYISKELENLPVLAKIRNFKVNASGDAIEGYIDF